MLVVLFFVMIFLGIANVAHKGNNIIYKKTKLKRDENWAFLRTKIKGYYLRIFPEKQFVELAQKLRDLPYIDDDTKRQHAENKNQILKDWYYKYRIPEQIRRYFNIDKGGGFPLNDFIKDVVEWEVKKIKDASREQLSLWGQFLPTYAACHPIILRRYKKIAPICVFTAALSFILFIIFGFIFTLANEKLNHTAEICMMVGTCVFWTIFGISLIVYEVMHSQVSNEIRDVWYHKWDEDYKPQIAIMIPPKKVWEQMIKTQKKSVRIKLLVSYILGILLIIAGSLTLGLLLNDGYSPTGPTDNAIAMGLGLPLMLIGFCICVISGAIFLAKYVKAFKVVKDWVNENPDEAIKLVPEDCRIYMDDYLNDYFEQCLKKKQEEEEKEKNKKINFYL